MIPIKHIETSGNGVMLDTGLDGGYRLTMNLTGANFPEQVFRFLNCYTPEEIHKKIITLERGIHTVAEGLRAQIEEESA